jgi:DNA-directed RNA polymerase specialized sigma24 family protein
MSERLAEKSHGLKDWQLTAPAFNQLLNWLDENKNSEGQRYLEIRRRLVSYFDRKACVAPDDLADETLNRVARRLQEEGHIETETPAKYCYIVARFVFMEYLRAAQKQNATLESLRRLTPETEDESAQLQRKEQMLECLDRCTGELDASNREIILKYYFGKERVKIENRRQLAESLGITMNALTIRACRIRGKVHACVQQCVGEKK